MTYNYLSNFVNKIQSGSRYFFTREEIVKHHPGSENAVKLALNRLSRKKRIVSVHKGFYIIIPPEYAASKILPPSLFIDDLMNYVGKKYYLGLLSAAAIHGAAHQQPQEYHIIIPSPKHSITTSGIKIKFFVKKGDWKNYTIVKHKTDAGYIRVSTPELTALDLIAYEKSIGGLNRVATVLHELADQMEPDTLLRVARKSCNISYIQRLGYLLEKILSRQKLVIPMKKWLQKQQLFRIPLKSGISTKGIPTDADWKVVINTNVESDFD
ncbi:MAG: type IV toxin-antitoxin system AbiEi family antitoxin domain-containing protein [bacterium]